MITGRGRYVDDMVVPGMLYMAVVRSPEAHAKIVSIDASGAKEQPGVHGVFTGEDLDLASGLPMAWVPPGVEIKTPEHWPLAKGEVKYVGQGVAVVVGERQVRASSTPPSRCSSSTTRCPVVVDPEKALEDGATLVHADLGTNQVARVVDRRRRHGRRVGRGRRRDRAADRQPPHRRRADRAARAASPTTAAASSRCTSRARTRTSSACSWPASSRWARTASA